MPTTLAIANVDTTLTTTLTEVIPAPAAGQEKRVSFTLTNTNAAGGADATFDIARTIGGVDRYLGKTVIVSVGKPQVFREVILNAGTSLKFRASAATTIDLVSDVLTKTVT